jgi:hypothetical protein
MIGQEKGDILIEVITWAGLTLQHKTKQKHNTLTCVGHLNMCWTPLFKHVLDTTI